MKKKYIILGGLVALMLATWLAFGMDSSEENTIYTKPQVGSFQVNITSSGELQAQNSTSINAPQIIRRFRINNVNILKMVPEGTVVQKGDFVAELDRSSVSGALQDAQLNLEEEEAQLEQGKLDSAINLSQARDNLVNLEYAVEDAKLVVDQSQYESPSVQRQAEISYEKAQRQVKQARANYKKKVKQAEVNLFRIQKEVEEERNDMSRIQKLMDEFTIYAPENGMVIYRRNRDGTKVKEGGSISAWDPGVAELPDFSVMESITYVNEVDIQSVKKGQKVIIGLDAMPDKKLTGTVTNVANIGEQQPNSSSKVFQVTIRVNESDSTLRPSMTTSNLIHINSVDSALYVPLETVHTQDSMDVVYKQNGQRMVMQQVIMGLINENDVIIKEGVNLDDRLYFSMPDDTTGIRHEYLSEEMLKKYRSSPQDLIERQNGKDIKLDAGPDQQKKRKEKKSSRGEKQGG